MKIILAEDVDRLGRMGALVDVADGYARNFLLPKKLATLATVKNVKELEHKKRVIADRVRKETHFAEGQAEKMNALNITIPAKTGEEGKLFGSITAKDICEALAAQGFEVDKRKILLERSIKEAGGYQISVKIHHNVTAQVKIEVVPSADE
ncbi:MAG: 50S ribosomal protein L9 [Nitrospiria bacterium]